MFTGGAARAGLIAEVAETQKKLGPGVVAYNFKMPLSARDLGLDFWAQHSVSQYRYRCQDELLLELVYACICNGVYKTQFQCDTPLLYRLSCTTNSKGDSNDGKRI